MKKNSLFYCFLFLLVFSGAADAGVMYTKSADTKVNSEKKGSSAVVEVLGAGAEVKTLVEEGRWVNVRTKGGNTGWVFKFKLSLEKPEEAGDDLFGGLLDTLDDSGIEAREDSTAGNIRGLKPVSANNAEMHQIKQKHVKDFEKMTSRSVARRELIEFLKSGKLGEYGE